MSFPQWCLFFDFHTMPANPDVGKGFDFEASTDWFVKAGVTYVVFPARCNLGTAYYDTEIGFKHKALTYDLLGELTKACHRKGIRISAYINLGLSHEEGLRHREWLVLRTNGVTYDLSTGKTPGSFFRQMCYNTGYGDHAVAMAAEVIEKCGVDGLFLDCMHTQPCVGVECIEAMRKENVDWHDAKQLNDFNHRKIVEMARRVSEAAKKVNPDIWLYFNGVGYEAQKELGTYLEFECLPTGGWGYETLQVGARYLRTLGKPVLNMTGRFHKSWGDFGGIRTKASLEYDCLYGIANALQTTIGDHFHPRGDINKAVAQLDTEIYNELQKLDPWLKDAEAVTEIAVPMLHPYPGYTHRAPEDQQVYAQNLTAIKSATRMLCELKQQFDIPSHAACWDKYDVLVLPDHVLLDDETKRRVEKHLRKGGKVIASAWSGLDTEQTGFAFPEWGVDYLGKDSFDPAFLAARPALGPGFPDMPMTLYDPGVKVAARNGTEVLGTIVAPYYNQHWDGEHGFVYLPPDQDTGRPAVTANDQVGYVTHPVFSTYFNSGPVPMRQIIANLLARLLPRPMVKTPDAPSFARVTVTSQPGRRMVYFLSYVPEQRGATCNMIEEPILVENQQIMLRQDTRAVKRVYLAPTQEEIPFTVEDGYVKVTLPKIKGWAVVVFEEN